MGFFVSAEQAEASAKIAKRDDRLAKKKQSLNPDAVGCDSCALKAVWPTLTSPRMPLFRTARDADLLILGEAPGEEEDHQGRPFVGKAGQLLLRALPGRLRERLAYQNAVRCRPPGNRDPAPAELHACRGFLADDIASLRPKAILGLGLVPLMRALPAGYPQPLINDIRGLRFPTRFGDHTCWYYPAFHPSFVARAGGERGTTWPVFQSDVRRFANEVDSWPDATIHKFSGDDVIQAFTQSDVEAVLERMKDPIAIDIETTALKPYKGHQKVLCASASDGDLTVAWPCYHPDAPNDWGWLLTKKIARTRQWIAHNASFELMWLWFDEPWDSWDPTGSFIDSMALGRIHQQRASMLALEDMAMLYLGIDLKVLYDVDRENCIGYGLDVLLPYCGLDSKASALIQRQLYPLVAGRNLERLHETIISDTRMELDGIPADQRLAKEQGDHFLGLAAQHQADADQLYEAYAFKDEFGRKLILSNNNDVGEALVRYGRCNLPKNQKGYETGEEVLLEFADDNPLTKLVLDFREVMKLESTYCRSIVNGKLLGNDGKVHPEFDCIRVRTGRLSSRNPNFQNMPSRKHREIRQQVKAPPGMIILSIDEGQLEARVCAMASKDRAFCQATIDKVDIHGKWRDRLLELHPEWIEVVAEISGETEDKALLKAARDKVKNGLVFAGFFGSQESSVATNLRIPMDINARLFREFWEEYRGVATWIEGVRQAYQRTGISSTLTGIARSEVLPGNEPINNPIQGTAAHIVLDAQNAISAIARSERDPHLLPRWNVHDELNFFVPDNDSDIKYYSDLITTEMVRIRYDFQIVPLAAEVSIGYDWSDLVEIAVVTGEYIR